MMRKISSRGVSIILVTQSLQDIIPEITRVVMMKSGKFVMDGPKEKVLTQKNVSALFLTPVKLMKRGGYYYAFE
jgi:iron complex transport system ATP-binding protein